MTMMANEAPICETNNFVGPICQPLLYFMVFLLGFLFLKKPKNDRHKKNNLNNLDKMFWTCPTLLGNQFGPCHFD